MFRRRPSVWMLLLVTLAIALPVCAERPPVPLKDQPIIFGKDPLQIEVHESGCFSDEKFRFRYEPLPSPRILVTYKAPMGVWDRRKRAYRNVSAHAFSWVTLTPAQVQRLNNLLTIYRASNGYFGSMNTSDVTIARMIKGRKVRSEQYSDRSDFMSYLSDVYPEDIATAQNYMDLIQDILRKKKNNWQPTKLWKALPVLCLPNIAYQKHITFPRKSSPKYTAPFEVKASRHFCL